jgi:pyruvate/2-oxoglutarate dehydrogenase complex dihydrolipoamide dehydrogenase (E3) component
MSETRQVDLCVIGAGSGGLSVAAGAVQMGASVALFERGKMGGDCLNYGCVPSKALLAAGQAAAHYGHTSQFGVNGSGAEIDFAAVNDHVNGVIAGIAPHDSVEGDEEYQEPPKQEAQAPGGGSA